MRTLRIALRNDYLPIRAITCLEIGRTNLLCQGGEFSPIVCRCIRGDQVKMTAINIATSWKFGKRTMLIRHRIRGYDVTSCMIVKSHSFVVPRLFLGEITKSRVFQPLYNKVQ